MKLIVRKDKDPSLSRLRIAVMMLWLLTILIALISCTGNEPGNNSATATGKQAGKGYCLLPQDNKTAADTCKETTAAVPVSNAKTNTSHTSGGKSTPGRNEDFNKFYADLTAALQKGNPTEINKFIHPEWGLYIVDRPGAIDKVDTARNIEQLYAKIYKGREQLQGMGCKLKISKMPVVDCETDVTSTECFAENVSSYIKISHLVAALKKHEFEENISIGPESRLSKFEKLVRWETVNMGKAIAMAFIEVNGKWYLGVVDFAKYSCSA